MTIFIFIDESGTLPDQKNKCVVLSAVATSNTESLSRLLQKTKKQSKTRKGLEVKFYSAGNKTREFYLSFLVKEKISIFNLAINKGSQKIPDFPENYAVLSWILLLDALAYFKKDNVKIIFDRHFQRAVDETKFFEILQKLIGRKIKATSADSLREPGLTAADMVAGAFLYAQSGKQVKFYEIVKTKVISEKVVNWKEAKRRFVEALKNSPEPM